MPGIKTAAGLQVSLVRPHDRRSSAPPHNLSGAPSAAHRGWAGSACFSPACQRLGAVLKPRPHPINESLLIAWGRGFSTAFEKSAAYAVGGAGGEKGIKETPQEGGVQWW